MSTNFFEHKDVKVVSKSETDSHETLVAEVKDGARTLIVQALKSKRAIGGDFLPAKIHLKGKDEPIWSFMELKAQGFNGLAKLFRLEVKGQPFNLIGLINKGSKLVSVVPISSLGTSILYNTEDYGLIYLGGQYQIHELICLKVQLARQENMGYALTSAEGALLETVSSAKRADEKALENARLEAKAERRREILNRPEISVFSQERSGKLHGIPVVGQEWMVLGNNQFAISVASYDPKTGQSGEPSEAFLVKKPGGSKVKRDRVITGLSYEPPKTATIPMSFKAFRLNNSIVSIPVVSAETLQDMSKSLNSGTKVAVQDGGRFKIYALEKGNSRSIGTFASL